MKRIILLFLLFLVGCSQKKTPNSPAELKQEITSVLSGLEGNFAVAFQSLTDSAETISINADDRFHAASTMKTPVLLEIYKQAENGKIELTDSIKVINTFKSIVDGSPYTMEVTADSESDLYDKVGKKATIYNLSYLMITKSSNLATNILIELVDAKKVTRTMRDIGADSIEVLRGVEDLKAYEAGLSNTTTARDLMILFKEIAKGNTVSDESRKEIIRILKDQEFNDMFPQGLPKEAEIAHKTGWITNTYHDSGIIFTPDGEAFVLVFLSDEAPNREAVQKASAEIANLCYQFVNLN